MTGAQLSALVVGLALVAAAVALVVAVRRKARDAGTEPGRPDAVSEEVVSGLLAEVRKWQAEAAYWKEQAERLQRELETPD
jgi:hypothetical protein